MKDLMKKSMAKRKEYMRRRKALRRRLDSGELSFMQWFNELGKLRGK